MSLIFNRIIAKANMTISNQLSFFEYYGVIIMRGGGVQIQYSAISF